MVNMRFNALVDPVTYLKLGQGYMVGNPLVGSPTAKLGWPGLVTMRQNDRTHTHTYI